MPLKLVPPRAGKTPFYSVRGTHLGRYVDRSTKTGVRALAEKIRKQIERAIERGSLAEPGAADFATAALAYMHAGGDRRFLAPLIRHFGRTALTGIDQISIDNAAAVLYPGASSATTNRQVYTPVSAVLKRAGLEHKIKRPRGWRGRRLTFWLSPEKAFAIFDAVAKINAPAEMRNEFRIFLRVLCYTGMRKSEPLRLRCSDIDIKAATAHLIDTKNGRPRLVHLPPVVVQELKRHPRGLDRDEPLFRFHIGGRLRLYGLLDMTLEAAGIELPARVAFHVFCHTWASWMRQHGGLDTFDLVKTDRWSDPESADRYAHVVVSDQAKRADLLPVRRKRGK